jgi:hypothetical protein
MKKEKKEEVHLPHFLLSLLILATVVSAVVGGCSGTGVRHVLLPTWRCHACSSHCCWLLLLPALLQLLPLQETDVTVEGDGVELQLEHGVTFG